MGEKWQRRERWLLGIYLAVSFGCLLPVSGVAFNRATPVLGIPASVLWIFLGLAALVLLTLAAYPLIFRPWSDRVDRRDRPPERSSEEP